MGQPMNRSCMPDRSLSRSGAGRDRHAAVQEASVLVSPVRTRAAIAAGLRQAIRRSARAAAIRRAVADVDREDILHGTR